jgi:hypothetical protein
MDVHQIRIPMTARYWSRQRKFSRRRVALTLHFTRHPGDCIIRVALRNRPAHDLIVVPPGASDKDMFLQVQQYARAVTRDEARALSTELSTYPQGAAA